MARPASFEDRPRRIGVSFSKLDLVRLNRVRRFLSGRREGAPFASAAVRFALAQAEREIVRLEGATPSKPVERR